MMIFMSRSRSSFREKVAMVIVLSVLLWTASNMRFRFLRKIKPKRLKFGDKQLLHQELANFFFQGPDSEYFRLAGPCRVGSIVPFCRLEVHHGSLRSFRRL